MFGLIVPGVRAVVYHCSAGLKVRENRMVADCGRGKQAGHRSWEAEREQGRGLGQAQPRVDNSSHAHLPRSPPSDPFKLWIHDEVTALIPAQKPRL